LVELAPKKTLAQRAYELMAGQVEGQFEAWDDLRPEVRGLFKERAANVESLPVFEMCCAAIVLGAIK